MVKGAAAAVDAGLETGLADRLWRRARVALTAPPPRSPQLRGPTCLDMGSGSLSLTARADRDPLPWHGPRSRGAGGAL